MSSRKLVAFILTACVTATSFAQAINGIGDFKVGMQLEEFLDLPFIKEKNMHEKAASKSVYSPGVSGLWKTTIDSPVAKQSLNPQGDRVYSADVVKFEFIAPMGVPKTDGDAYPTTIKFYKGKLASVAVFNAGSEFEKILTTKYGQPVKEDKTKRVTCQNGLGATSSELEGADLSIWGERTENYRDIQNVFFLLWQERFVVHSCGCGKRETLASNRTRWCQSTGC